MVLCVYLCEQCIGQCNGSASWTLISISHCIFVQCVFPVCESRPLDKHLLTTWRGRNKVCRFSGPNGAADLEICLNGLGVRILYLFTFFSLMNGELLIHFSHKCRTLTSLWSGQNYPLLKLSPWILITPAFSPSNSFQFDFFLQLWWCTTQQERPGN